MPEPLFDKKLAKKKIGLNLKKIDKKLYITLKIIKKQGADLEFSRRMGWGEGDWC